MDVNGTLKLIDTNITCNTAKLYGGIFNNCTTYKDTLAQITGNFPNDISGNPIQPLQSNQYTLTTKNTNIRTKKPI
jgi:hypothetical protein